MSDDMPELTEEGVIPGGILCAFNVCGGLAVGAFWVRGPGIAPYALAVCKIHGDAIAHSGAPFNSIGARQSLGKRRGEMR